MKKLKRVTGMILLLGVVVLIGGRMGIARIWKSAFENYGAALTEVPVTAERVWISPLAGKVHIGGLKVGNPEGFKSSEALVAERVDLTLEWRSLFQSKTIIRDLSVVGAQVTYERDLLRSNLGAISEPVRMKARSKNPVLSKLQRRVHADRVLLDGGRVNLSATLLGGRGVGVRLPRLELRDLGQDEKGITVMELTSEILKALLEGAVGLSRSTGPAGSAV